MTPGNPYTLTFGKEPTQLIQRAALKQALLNDLLATPASNQVFMITGVRGAGKTVFMTEVASELAQDPSWLVLELNPQRDMLQGLAAKLASQQALGEALRAAKVDLSLFGLGVTIDGSTPIADIETAIQRMLQTAASKGKRVLLCVDEVDNNEFMREFAHAFQILLRADLPVYLLMTGLYESIRSLQNERGLTFLFRTPRTTLGPLNIAAAARDYARVIGLAPDAALAMANETLGYAFAFQVFGHFAWKRPDDLASVREDARLYLEEYCYDKIWAELSQKDREVAQAIALTPSSQVRDIRAQLGMASNQFSPYRDRLARAGLVTTAEYGHLTFSLPFFAEYAASHAVSYD